jgi:hypothetical protein
MSVSFQVTSHQPLHSTAVLENQNAANILLLHRQRGTAVSSKVVPTNSEKEFKEFGYSTGYFSPLIVRRKIPGEFESFAIEFETPHDQEEFLQKEESFASEHSHIKFNIYGDSLIEIIMPMTCLESCMGCNVNRKLLGAIREQLYLPGVSDDETQMTDFGAACVSSVMAILTFHSGGNQLGFQATRSPTRFLGNREQVVSCRRDGDY